MPNQRARPTLRRRRLGEQLEARRAAANLSLEAAAALMGWDKFKLSKIENARQHIAARDVELLLSHHYGVEDAQFINSMTALARDTGKRGWWAGFGAVGDSYEDLLSVDDDASDMRFYSSDLVPGLLQRGPYAGQVINSTAINRSAEDKEGFVRLRLARQSVLERSPNPLRLWAVIGEAALRHTFPDPDAMRDQLAYLLEASTRTNITVQVMPLLNGAHPGIAGMFNIISFPSPWPTVVNLENLRGGTFVEGTQDVAIFEDAFSQIVANALSPDESRDTIKMILKEQHA
ncbi:helix-turn-helix transcriptional regulator [Streptomyces sp. NPDC047014]|uniref:helix-turn-helix domain-containing protein n=1 Tax=Streptomyces sp. NPDC047014 TaxID=3155736 RepID=UPI0033E8AACB